MVRAERSSGCRSAWSGIRARASQLRQNCTVVVDVDGGLDGVARAGEALGPGQRAEGPLALVQHVPGARRAALDPDQHVGAEPERRAGRVGGVGAVALGVGEGPGGLDPAVVEGRLADQLDLDRALEALHGAHEQVVGVVVRRRPGVRGHRVRPAARSHHQRVVHHDPPARRVPGGHQDVGARDVGPRRRHVDAVRPEPERARAPVEDVAEDAGRVEGGQAEPVDRAVGGDQGAGMAVREEPVVGDRRKGGGGDTHVAAPSRSTASRRIAASCSASTAPLQEASPQGDEVGGRAHPPSLVCRQGRSGLAVEQVLERRRVGERVIGQRWCRGAGPDRRARRRRGRCARTGSRR